MPETQEQLLSEIRDLLRESNERGKRIETATQARLTTVARWPLFIFVVFVVFSILTLLK